MGYIVLFYYDYLNKEIGLILSHGKPKPKFELSNLCKFKEIA